MVFSDCIELVSVSDEELIPLLLLFTIDCLFKLLDDCLLLSALKKPSLYLLRDMSLSGLFDANCFPKLDQPLCSLLFLSEKLLSFALSELPAKSACYLS